MWYAWALLVGTNLVLGFVVWYLRKLNRALEGALWALRDARAETALVVQAANERARRAEAALSVKLRLEALDDRAQLETIDRMAPGARAKFIADLLNKLPGRTADGGGTPAPTVPPPGSDPVPKP